MITLGKIISAGCVCVCLLTTAAFAQSANDTVTVSVPDLMQGVQQWAQDNLDTNVVASLTQQIDPAVVQRFYRDLQARYQGGIVVDLAPLRQTAQVLLPVLQSRAESRPYAAWLQAQLDYFDVADQIRRAAPVPPPGTNQPPPVIKNPSPQKERELWVHQETGRPWPTAAKTYVGQLKPIFAAAKVPPELVWVAEVESGFDREAESPAGAAGLFQLMPDTARRFGLSLWPRDQRYQAVPSARASAEYFKYLHDRFQDWRLVMAAYNAGEGTVQKLLTRQKTCSYDAIAGHLPAETQMYVPRIEAILKEREGTTLEQLVTPPA
jgi:membrane-bound lytic murein transglycosylase D